MVIQEPYTKSLETILKESESNIKSGLTKEEAKKRLETYGKNELAAKEKINPLKIFISQFKSFIIYILIFAVAISLIAQEYVDATIILIILLFNSFFGFFQEYKAEKAIDALKKLSGLKASVIRGKKTIEIDASELVPGDIILLEAGSKISADARLIEALGLEVSESSLTGESIPSPKHCRTISKKMPIAEIENMVFSGTSVAKGRARAIVINTGMKTEIGKIAGMVSESKDELTPLQRNLNSLGKRIGIITLLICLAIFFIGIAKDGIFSLLLQGEFLEFVLASKNWLLIATSLAVAAVPEGLPIVVTIALALGTRKLLSRNVLIRKLPSVETLGETNVICTDKTGTITRNQMTVRSVFVNQRTINFNGRGYDLKGEPDKLLSKNDQLLFRIGTLCNESTFEKENEMQRGDPTELALHVSASKAGLDFASIQKEWKIVDEMPFDSNRKLMSTVNVEPKTLKKYVFTKGAPENLLEKCNKIIRNGNIVLLSEKEKEKILEKNDEFAKDALRVLGFAYKPYGKKEKDFENDLIFVGLQAMIDPPHKEVKESIQKCKDAGIRVVMMTGDNLHTAEAIGKEIGLGSNAIRGIEFEKLSKREKGKAIKKISIFARVEPGQKLEIVRLLQDAGFIVSMTGDGVNDAPAVKHANLGIAMGISGSDVTKEASEMILQDDNFVSITRAIEEGRGIYTNIRKFVNYLFSSNIAEVLIVLFAILFGWNLPLTAIMLLWINLVTDGLPALALSVDPIPKDIMKEAPRSSREGIMTKKMTATIMHISTLMAAGVIGLFYFGIKAYSLPRAQTIAFTALIVMELIRLQTVRSESKVGMFSNKYLIFAVTISFALQLGVIYTPINRFFGTVPLGAYDWGAIFVVSFIVFILNILGTKIIKKIFKN
jgi:P-type Ca2+ transporter type 2C